MKQRDALIDEIQSVKEEEEQEREALKQEHQVQLSDLKEALQRQYEESLHTGIAASKRVVALLRITYVNLCSCCSDKLRRGTPGNKD